MECVYVIGCKDNCSCRLRYVRTCNRIADEFCLVEKLTELFQAVYTMLLQVIVDRL